MRLLFVCSGNTCRSPMAAYYLRHILQARLGSLGEQIVIESAGVYALDGEPASEGALAALQAVGVSGVEHRSRRLASELIEEADLVLTMTRSHREAVLRQEPESAGKVYTLAEYAGQDTDIPDPYGSPVEVYSRTLREMIPLLEKVADKICEQLEQKGCD